MTYGCKELVIEGGAWTEVDIQVERDTCRLETKLKGLEGDLQYSLSKRTLPAEKGGVIPTHSEKLLNKAHNDLWEAMGTHDGPQFELVFSPLALHADRWNPGLFMHEDCDGQPSSINVGGSASGMVVNSTEIILSSEIIPRCMQDESVLRWCTLEYTSRLVPAKNNGK